MPSKSEKKPQKECVVCSWAYLSKVQGCRLPWGQGGLQTTGAGGSALKGWSCLKTQELIPSVLMATFLWANYSSVVVTRVLLLICFFDYGSNADSV